MINNVSKLTFKADKKPVLPQKNEQVSLLKIYNQGDKATLSTEESKKQNPPVNKHLFSLRNITVASFLILGSVMLFAVLSPADIPKSWEKAKEKAKEIKTRIVEFFKNHNSSGVEGAGSSSASGNPPLPSVGGGASNEAGGFVKDSLGKMISTISTFFTTVKEKATEEIKVIQTALDDVLKKEGDSGTPASKKVAGWIKAPLEKISSVVSEISTKTKQTFVEVKIKIDKFLKKPEILKEKAVVVKKEAPKVSVKLNTGTPQVVVKLDKAAEKAKAEVTQLTEKLENKTITPETFVDNALNAIEKQAEEISSTVQEAVQLNSDKTLKSVDSAGVAKLQSQRAQVKEVTSSVSKPIIDMADEAGKKLTGKPLETAGQELIARTDHPTDKVVVIEEVFNRKADDVSKSLKTVNSPTEKEIKEAGKKVEEACNQAVKELHASGEPEQAKLFAEQYEGFVERANPVIVDEKRVLTAEAKKLVESLEQKNKKIAAFKTLINEKKDFTEIQSAYNQTIAELKQAGATEQAKGFETYFKPKLESLESASIAKATKTTKSKAVNAASESLSNFSSEVKAEVPKQAESLAKETATTKSQTVNSASESLPKVSVELKPEISKQAESLAKGTKVEAETIKTATTKPQEAVITVTKSKPKVPAELKQEPGSIHLKREGNLLDEHIKLQEELKAKEVKTELPKQAEPVKPQQDLAKMAETKEKGRIHLGGEENLLDEHRAWLDKCNNS